MSYNYGSYGNYQNAQNQQQQSTTSSQGYSGQSYQSYSDARSNAPTTSNQQTGAFNPSLGRYQYGQVGTSTAGNWVNNNSNGYQNTTSYQPRTTTAQDQRYGAVTTAAYGSNTYASASAPVSTLLQTPQTQYSNYNNSSNNYAQQPQQRNWTTQATYGQQQARPDSVSSVGSVAQPPQSASTQPQYQSYQPQRNVHDRQATTRSPMPVQQQSQATQYQQTGQSRSPNVAYVHNRQPSRPQNTQEQQQPNHSPAVPAPVTVDPSQVYDRSAEIQREAARLEAARRADEEQRAEEERKRKEEERRKEEESRNKRQEDSIRQQEEAARNVPSATNGAKKPSKKTAKDPNAPPKKKGRKSNADKAAAAASASSDAAMNAAAMTLLQTANAGGGASGDDLEGQMRAMFAKMREFNAKNPEMLSRMWQQERESYLAGDKEKPQEKNAEQAPQAQSQAQSKLPATPTPTATSANARKKTTPKKGKSVGLEAQQAPQPAAIQQSNPPTSQAQHPMNGLPTPASSTPAKKQTLSNSSAKVSKPKGGTIWPESQKKQLSEAAESLLSKKNNGRTIPAAEIAQILDGNPTYLELCNQIEDRGFQLNKTQFAQALLQAVPEINKKKPSTASPSTPQTATFTPMNASNTAQDRAALGDAENRLLSGGSVIAPPKARMKTTPSKHKDTQASTFTNGANGASANDDLPTFDTGFEGLEAVKQFNEAPADNVASLPGSNMQIKMYSPANEVKKKQKRPSTSKAPVIPPPPPTKEDNARKRTFADLVDLTTLSDDDMRPPMKRANAQTDGNTPGDQLQQLPSPPSDSQLPPQPHPQPHSEQLHTPHAPQALMHQQAPQVPAMGTFRAYPPPPTPSGQFSSYPMPTYPPPKPAVMQSVKPPPAVPREHPINNILPAEKLKKSNALRRSTYNRKTIARDVLLAAGRHPSMRHLNAHLDVLHNLRLTNDTDLSTIRWDVIDPGGAVVGAGVSNEPLPEDEIDNDPAVLGDVDSDDESTTGGPTVSTATISMGNASGPVLSTLRGPGAQLIPRRHGTAKPSLKPTFKIDRNRPRASDPLARTTSTPNRPTTLTTPSTDPQAGSSYAALRAQQAATGSAPKKGRPVGWRKWMQKGGSGTPAPAATPKPRGRPVGWKPSKPAPKQPSPEFLPFKCGWQDCTAELHNLDTLRKHLYKQHRRLGNSGQYPCFWDGCGHAIAVKDGPRTVSKFERVRVDTEVEWNQHVEDEHLVPIRWEKGDGPSAGLIERGGGAGEVSDAVLSDREGRQVTPRIAMPSSPAEAVQTVIEGRAAGSQGPAPGSGRSSRRRTPQEEAEMEVYSAEEKRRRLGAGIDKGGATLATDKRRRGFVEDGDIEVISEDSE